MEAPTRNRRKNGSSKTWKDFPAEPLQKVLQVSRKDDQEDTLG